MNEDYDADDENKTDQALMVLSTVPLIKNPKGFLEAGETLEKVELKNYANGDV